MYSVLLVEDDVQIREVIGDYFGRRDKISLDFAEDGNIGLSKFLNGSYDLIVLDIMMPGLDGFELCKIIRKKSDIPIVFLTGKVREEDVLYGYELGADDYIVKPFSIKILYSKLNAILERNKSDEQPRKIIESGQITLDPVKQHPGAAITRKLLLAVAWGDDMYITERVIDNRVKNLRHKLQKEGARIKTLIGVGYRFE